MIILYFLKYHFLCPALSDTSLLFARTSLQVVIPLCIIENSRQLIINGFEIHFRITLFQHFILPLSNIRHLDFVDCTTSKVRENFQINNVPLGAYCVFFQPRFHILQINLHKLVEPHLQITFLLLQKIPCPCLRF